MSASSLISPLIWQATPFDRDAILDFLFSHSLWHLALAQNTKTRFILTDDLGGAWRSLLAQGLTTRDDIKVTTGEMLRHSNMHKAVDKALGVAQAFDLTAYDLNQRDSFIAFLSAHSLQHDAERKAAKL